MSSFHIDGQKLHFSALLSQAPQADLDSCLEVVEVLYWQLCEALKASWEGGRGIPLCS